VTKDDTVNAVAEIMADTNVACVKTNILQWTKIVPLKQNKNNKITNGRKTQPVRSCSGKQEAHFKRRTYVDPHHTGNVTTNSSAETHRRSQYKHLHCLYTLSVLWPLRHWSASMAA